MTNNSTTTMYNPDGSSFEHGFEVLLMPREAAAILRVDVRTLANYARAGKIRCTATNGGRRRYYADSIRAAYEGRWDDAAVKRDVDEMHQDDVLVYVPEK